MKGSGMLLKKVWDFLGSRNLSVFIFVMATTYVLILFIFAFFIPVWWVDNIASLLPYKFLYLIFFVNLIICEIKWIPVVIRQCRRVQLSESEEELKKFRYRQAVQIKGLRVQAFKRYLKRRGYKVHVPECGMENAGGNNNATLLHAYRGRFSPIGNLLFHTSFLFLLLGVIMSMLFSFEGTAMLTEGYPFSGSRGEYKSISASPMASLPKVTFDLKRISASFWEGKMLFTGLEAELAHAGGVEVAQLSSPVAVGDANVTISGYGYAPMYALKEKRDRLVDQGYVNLNVFIPGSEDHFQIPGYPHRIFVTFFPDYDEKKEGLPNRSMSPNNPAYGLRILRGRLPVYTGIVRQGEWADFDGMRISFPTFARWGDFKIVNNPGALYIWIAFIMMGVGLVWKLLFYRRELLLRQDGVGSVWLAGHFDYYPKLNANWLENVAEKFGEKG